MIPALDLESPLKWWDWRRRLHAFVWLKDCEIKSKSDPYQVWHDFKFLCQEVDRKQADQIGKSLANMPQKITAAFIERWKKEVLSLIRQPSAPAKIHSYLRKHIAYYSKQLCKDTLSFSEQSIKAGSRSFVKQLHEMEKLAILHEVSFSGTPVIYRQVK